MSRTRLDKLRDTYLPIFVVFVVIPTVVFLLVVSMIPFIKE